MAVSLVAIAANAHDPSMHKTENRAPDCTAMHDMADSTMPVNDLVAKAMKIKCPEGMQGHDEMPESKHQMHTTGKPGASMSSMDEDMKHSQ